MKANLADAAARLNAFGLSAKAGTVDFRDFGNGSPISTLVDSDFHSAERYGIASGEVRAGDEYCSSAGIDAIDILKIDVEGAEFRVLAGFNRMLEARQIRCIQFEHGYANGDDHVLLRDFHRFFETRGYIVGKLWERGVSFGAFAYSQNQFTSGPNYVAIRQDDSVCRQLIERRP